MPRSGIGPAGPPTLMPTSERASPAALPLRSHSPVPITYLELPP